MIKKIKTILTIALSAGKANPAPPVGPILGQHGINIINFCKDYNLQTIDKVGFIIPATVTIYDDRSYSFILKSSPASNLILKFADLKKGSSKPNKEIVGSIKKEQILEIAKIKLNDLNTNNLIKAIKIIEGTAKNMGIQIND